MKNALAFILSLALLCSAFSGCTSEEDFTPKEGSPAVENILLEAFGKFEEDSLALLKLTDKDRIETQSDLERGYTGKFDWCGMKLSTDCYFGFEEGIPAMFRATVPISLDDTGKETVSTIIDMFIERFGSPYSVTSTRQNPTKFDKNKLVTTPFSEAPADWKESGLQVFWETTDYENPPYIRYTFYLDEKKNYPVERVEIRIMRDRDTEDSSKCSPDKCTIYMEMIRQVTMIVRDEWTPDE